MERKIPEGIIILTLLSFFMSCWAIVVSVYYLIVKLPTLSFMQISLWYKLTVPPTNIFATFIGLALMMLYCIAAYKVLKLENWARRLFIGLSFASIFSPFGSVIYFEKHLIFDQVRYSISPYGAMPWHSVSTIFCSTIIIYVANIIYFTRSRVKALFVSKDKQKFLDAIEEIAKKIKFISVLIALVVLNMSVIGTIKAVNLQKKRAKIDPSEIKTILEALKDNNIYIQQYAYSLLSQIRDNKEIDLLIASLKSEDDRVRCGAAEALGSIGDIRAVEPLIASLKNEASKFGCPCASVIIRALRKITNENFEYDYIKWKEWWKKYKESLDQ